MPKFFYKARKTPTEIMEGTIEADNLDAAIDRITALGYVPFDVSLDSGHPDPQPKTRERLSLILTGRIPLFDVGIFIRQLHDLVDAGVPILRALQITNHQTKNLKLKTIIADLKKVVEDGGTLSQAMAQYPKIFSNLTVHLVKSGELGGNLNVVLNRLSQFIEKDLETRSKIKSSLAYPLLILIMGCVTIFVLLSFVVPKLTVMFEDMTETLPLPTTILIAISAFFSRFWWLVLAGALAAGVVVHRFLNSMEGKLWFDRIKLRLPVLGNFIQEVEIGRFARTLATLLDSGVVIVTALESVWASMDNEVLKLEIKKVSEDVAGGMSLTNALKPCSSFPEIAINMIAVGEETGRLEQALYKLAESYEKQSDRSVKVVTSLLEPLMIVVVGVIVFFIVMAVILPIFKMNQIIR